jgi:hypothetical protein
VIVPDRYTVAVLRKYSPGPFAELAAWLLAIAARLANVFVLVTSAPSVWLPPVIPVLAADTRVPWSAPAGADSMRTGPPRRPWQTPHGAGRT